ncbi:MAG: nucleoside deaminase [Nitrospiraceae bacterium]|nr:nucleoside deaminase [Nitrospiraceae bacterium]
MSYPVWQFELPEWIEDLAADFDAQSASDEERMRFVIGLAKENVAHGTGGPFGAAVFDLETGRLVAPGVNLVVSSHCSHAHAEMAAIAIAQRVRDTFDLGAPGQAPCELVSSAEPCAMCMGAVVWSGVRRLVCGARDEDVRAVGFDEGPKMAGWAGAFEQRGLRVVQDVLRGEAAAVLKAYRDGSGAIYNARRGTPNVG